MHTLKLNLNLWKTVNNMFDDPHKTPFPPIKKISPSILVKWNCTKGGCDVDTRYGANNVAPYHNMSVEMALFDKLIMKATIAAYHMFRWSTVACKLSEISNTDTLIKAAGRLSFHDFLLSLSSNINSSCPVEINNNNENSTFAWTADFFKSPIGIQIRTLNADHIFCTEKSPKNCKVCNVHRTIYKCPTCNVFLCTSKQKGVDMTCYEYFHSNRAVILKRFANSSESSRKKAKSRGKSNIR
jgi:hypothetical protein